MTLIDAREVPADPASAEALRSAALEYRVVDMADDTQAAAFRRAVTRGFLGAEPSPEALEAERESFASRRNIEVIDPAASAGSFPVATVNSWVTPLTVPGGTDVGMWAISAVTVAATHRRRGIARALLEGELRAAASAGIAVAGLTVSEATIYGRYGFGPAVPVAAIEVDTRRAGWAGGEPTGRIEYIDRETLADDLAAVHERVRRSRPGRIPGWRTRWQGHAGVSPHITERDAVRGVRHVDDAGRVTGVLAYTLKERQGTFRFGLAVRILVAETNEALAALWRFALQHDLVDEVNADLRPLDDPLPWMVTDQRGVTRTEHDHGWLRILDVPAALGARRYSAPLDLVVRAEDPLGFAAGDWRVHIDADGAASVEPDDTDRVDAVLGVAALSSMYVGGVRASTLYAAGRIEADPAVVDQLDRAFISFPAPTLDIWY